MHIKRQEGRGRVRICWTFVVVLVGEGGVQPCFASQLGVSMQANVVGVFDSQLIRLRVQKLTHYDHHCCCCCCRYHEAYERQYAADHSWESLQEDEQGFLRPLVSNLAAGPWLPAQGAGRREGGLGK